jgi:hypothetical protein
MVHRAGRVDRICLAAGDALGAGGRSAAPARRSKPCAGPHWACSVSAPWGGAWETFRRGDLRHPFRRHAAMLSDADKRGTRGSGCHEIPAERGRAACRCAHDAARGAMCLGELGLYRGEESQDGPIDLTYWMNSLQPIPQDDPLFVTLNTRPIREELIYDQTTLRHPVYDLRRARGAGADPARSTATNHMVLRGLDEERVSRGRAVERRRCGRGDRGGPACRSWRPNDGLDHIAGRPFTVARGGAQRFRYGVDYVLLDPRRRRPRRAVLAQPVATWPRCTTATMAARPSTGPARPGCAGFCARHRCR